MDLLHVFHQFVADLPASYDEFKNHLNALFPSVFDTKQILQENQKVGNRFPTSTLGEVHAKMTELNLGLPVVLADGFSRYADSQGLHEAGADAYITGLAFLGICELASTDLGTSSDSDSNHPHYPTSPVVACYSNHLHLMRIRGYMKLDGLDEFPARSSLLWLSGLTSEIRTSDLARHFVDCGKFKVHWLEDAQCVVQFFNDLLVIDDAWIKKMSKGASFAVRSIQEYDSASQIQSQNDDDAPASPGRFKRKRRRETESTEPPKPKRRRLSLGGVSCQIS